MCKQPFNVGDKVVKICNDFKGEVFTVLDIKLCCEKCNVWVIDIGKELFGILVCECGNRTNICDHISWFITTSFRKVDRLRREHKFEITCTLPQSVDEVSDEPVKIKS